MWVKIPLQSTKYTRLFFWPVISAHALGVFFNFDNELMRPPKYPSAPGRECSSDGEDINQFHKYH